MLGAYRTTFRYLCALRIRRLLGLLNLVNLEQYMLHVYTAVDLPRCTVQLSR
eukprot:SAG31_NODE_23754_length_497_cov_0.731156_1_plen_51_part_10